MLDVRSGGAPIGCNVAGGTAIPVSSRHVFCFGLTTGHPFLLPHEQSTRLSLWTANSVGCLQIKKQAVFDEITRCSDFNLKFIYMMVVDLRSLSS